MKKKLVMIAIAVAVMTGSAYACLTYKQCCRRGLGGLECIQKCEFEFCPLSHPIEIK